MWVERLPIKFTPSISYHFLCSRGDCLAPSVRVWMNFLATNYSVSLAQRDPYWARFTCKYSLAADSVASVYVVEDPKSRSVGGLAEQGNGVCTFTELLEREKKASDIPSSSWEKPLGICRANTTFMQVPLCYGMCFNGQGETTRPRESDFSGCQAIWLRERTTVICGPQGWDAVIKTLVGRMCESTCDRLFERRYISRHLAEDEAPQSRDFYTGTRVSLRTLQPWVCDISAPSV